MHPFVPERRGEEQTADCRHSSCHLMGMHLKEGFVYCCSEGCKTCMNWKARGKHHLLSVQEFLCPEGFDPTKLDSSCTTASLSGGPVWACSIQEVKTASELLSIYLLLSLPFLIQANLLSFSLLFWLLALKSPSLLPSPLSPPESSWQEEEKQDFAVNSKRVSWH